MLWCSSLAAFRSRTWLSQGASRSQPDRLAPQGAAQVLPGAPSMIGTLLHSRATNCGPNRCLWGCQVRAPPI